MSEPSSEPSTEPRRRESHTEIAFAITALCDAFRLSSSDRHRRAALALADLLTDDVLGPDGPPQRHP